MDFSDNFPLCANVKLLLKDNPDLCMEIEKKVREYYDISLEKKEEPKTKGKDK